MWVRIHGRLYENYQIISSYLWKSVCGIVEWNDLNVIGEPEHEIVSRYQVRCNNTHCDWAMTLHY